MAAAADSFSRGRNLRMRIAQERDVDAIVRLINAAFIVERIAFDGDRIDAQGVGELLKKGAFLLAEDAAELPVRADRMDPRVGLSGCVYVEAVGERSYLGLLCVDPGRQGTGLGRRLVAARPKNIRAMPNVARWICGSSVRARKGSCHFMNILATRRRGPRRFLLMSSQRCRAITSRWPSRSHRLYVADADRGAELGLLNQPAHDGRVPSAV